MIDIYNCREQGECYLTYRRRLAKEKTDYEQSRPIRQTNADWLAEYAHACADRPVQRRG
jgi:hypothetical protein